MTLTVTILLALASLALIALTVWAVGRQTVEVEPVHRVKHHPFTILADQRPFDWVVECSDLWTDAQVDKVLSVVRGEGVA